MTARAPTAVVRWLTLGLCLSCVSCHAEFADPSRRVAEPVDPDAPRHPVYVHQPESIGLVDTDQVDARGVPIRVACTTCHGQLAGIADAGPSPHGDVDVRHGTLRCDACHAADRDGLHLADGRRLPFRQVHDLCTQCHGTQVRDFARGSHGGTTGYWDLRRGPQRRNGCVDCHAPHDPAQGQVLPVMPPRDRYLSGGRRP